jgi:dihydroorotate dehydrogenase electron transfer subunit
LSFVEESISRAHEPASAGSFLQRTVAVVENVRLARDTYRIRLHSPELAQAFRPGQFLMLRLPRIIDPLLGRPFALYDTVLDPAGQPESIDIGYLVVGKLTRLMTALSGGDQVEVWGPLGNGFPELAGLEHVGFVAGGIGQTPFLAFARQLLGARGYAGRPARKSVERISLYYGVRTADLAAGVEDFRKAAVTVHLATDDGTLGHHGIVTQLLERQERLQHLVGCGPEPMMKALARLARQWDVPCHLSLESPMACGVGICFSCVTPVRGDGGADYRRVCVEGPVFDAGCLAWEDD